MSRRTQILLALACVMIAALAVVKYESNIVLRTVFSVPVILFIPGYSATLALDPQREGFKSNGTLLWSIGISISIVVIGGLFLDLVSTIDETTWIMYLSIVVFVLLIIAWRRDSSVGRIAIFGSKIGRRLGMVVLVGIPVFVVAGSEIKANSVPSNPYVVPKHSQNDVGRCPIVNAIGTIKIAIGTSPSGDYNVLALGSVKNLSSAPLTNVEVTWRISYADLSQGLPTHTLTTDWRIGSDATSAWGGLSATNDGGVPPVSAQIVKITGAKGSNICAGQ